MTEEQANALIAAVRLMRHKQRAYFRARQASDLKDAKQAEREVDAILAEIENNGKPRQGELL